MTEYTYPVASGYRDQGASRLAAAAVDADPDRKLTFYIRSAMKLVLDYTTEAICPDDLAAHCQEPVLYARPLVTCLAKLGIAEKTTSMKVSDTFKRKANIIQPSADLQEWVARHEAQIETEHDLELVVERFVVSRIAEAQMAQARAKRGPQQ